MRKIKKEIIKFFESVMLCKVKFNDFEALITQNIQKIKKKKMKFFQSLMHSNVIFNNFEAINM